MGNENAVHNLLRTFFNSIAGKEILKNGGAYKYSASNQNIIGTCAGIRTDYYIQMNPNSLRKGNMTIDIYFINETGDSEIMHHDYTTFDIKDDRLI